MGNILQHRFVGELYEAVDTMIFVYAKPHGSILYALCEVKCTFRPLHVVYGQIYK